MALIYTGAYAHDVCKKLFSKDGHSYHLSEEDRQWYAERCYGLYEKPDGKWVAFDNTTYQFFRCEFSSKEEAMEFICPDEENPYDFFLGEDAEARYNYLADKMALYSDYWICPLKFINPTVGLFENKYEWTAFVLHNNVEWKVRGFKTHEEANAWIDAEML